MCIPPVGRVIFVLVQAPLTLLYPTSYIQPDVSRSIVMRLNEEQQ